MSENENIEKRKPAPEEPGERIEEAAEAAEERVKETADASEAAGRRARRAAAAAGEKAREFAGTAAGRVRELSESPEFRSIGPLTWLGLGLAFLFLVFMPFDALNLRWWIMLPLAIAAVVILWFQWASARGEKRFEAKVCLGGLIAILALILLRDIMLSRSLLEIYDTTSALDSTLDEVNRALGK